MAKLTTKIHNSFLIDLICIVLIVQVRSQIKCSDSCYNGYSNHYTYFYTGCQDCYRFCYETGRNYQIERWNHSFTTNCSETCTKSEGIWENSSLPRKVSCYKMKTTCVRNRRGYSNTTWNTNIYSQDQCWFASKDVGLQLEAIQVLVGIGIALLIIISAQRSIKYFCLNKNKKIDQTFKTEREKQPGILCSICSNGLGSEVDCYQFECRHNFHVSCLSKQIEGTKECQKCKKMSGIDVNYND